MSSYLLPVILHGMAARLSVFPANIVRFPDFPFSLNSQKREGNQMEYHQLYIMKHNKLPTDSIQAFKTALTKK
jgi:hypothetical protein